MKNQTGLQFNRSEFFVTERTDEVLDRNAIETKLDQLNDLMEEIAKREKQLINLRNRLELPPVEITTDVLEEVELHENGRKVRKDKGKKRVAHVKGHFKNINGEQVWVDGFKRNLTKEDSPLKGQKQKGHYRTSKNGIRHYVGKKPMSLKLKELVGLA
ncbi:MAG: hypothetical protein CBC83_00580 [Flavobacteriales bacterium TMED123]|nr:MAG: hypothetical protein CBC83_00580 [Flavobacteriales bacterium TMED123]|tara:strand:- start:12 stop:485 length:474 start_codon:yes stop_codon:yes gene_type:complete